MEQRSEAENERAMRTDEAEVIAQQWAESPLLRVAVIQEHGTPPS